MFFEYSAYDGNQPFRSLSAATVFDKLTDYILAHVDYILRHL